MSRWMDNELRAHVLYESRDRGAIGHVELLEARSRAVAVSAHCTVPESLHQLSPDEAGGPNYQDLHQ